ncbi:MULTISPECIES: alpha/beta fold hydrolase [Pseudomonas]|uniref:Hydrolase n=2 Tax=Pseudomonas fluorescens TaxID=294 RepID=C3K7V4_PSEFS|nr:MULTISPECIES: alpha/beta hydrolase [Pseudomonas]KJZ51288.1 sigma factor sigB regulation protein rsbQ [Pseudomonas marginalis]KJZ60228.1 sigma factor sigB regulation protein rsbQ [Pseudomonas marginalis]MBZ6456245.1 alpha/beta hydrolase [Pseudomonas fluorescens group sp.]MBZ6460556.1 alpha/beta hydrolase [Pseudomonas fluorescens group sp.]MBZ6466198.1 alpha/beta hydrolase [Pseudomonas fluorescens group sp.]
MDLLHRNNVSVMGSGTSTLVFSHGFGCNQAMWNYLAPHFLERFRVVMYDLVGAGLSDLSAFDKAKYSTLDGYARDLNEIIDAYAVGPVILVGHSVSAMIGALADRLAPGRVAAHVMIGPSPRYIDDDGYIGGFKHSDIDDLLDTLDSNYLGWSSAMAPVIMGAQGQSALGVELTESFCRTEPEIAKQFARVTFMSDNRQDVIGLATPVLILQSTDDLIAPVAVGEYLHRVLPNSSYCLVDNIGHCPHMSAPQACATAMDSFLAHWAAARAS